jgi:hypothetical protein
VGAEKAATYSGMKVAFTNFFICLHWIVSVHCSASERHFDNWSPLETRSGNVHIVASDTSMLADSEKSVETLQYHMSYVSARSSSSSAGFSGVDWPPKINAHLLSLLPNEEQHYVQFAIRVDGVTAAVFESFTGRPLLSMVADKAFVAVGCSAWTQRARAFPGVVFVASRSHESKVDIY